MTTKSTASFSETLSTLKERVEVGLKRYLPVNSNNQSHLTEAMSYSLFAGGKRLRPILVLLTCEACGGNEEDAMPAACAIEMLHTYSLIHDDLPAMDNDDLRRGKPTCHKAFDEATAILAGDALLTAAMLILSKEIHDPAKSQALSRLVAEAAGLDGMVGGQQADLEAENRTDLEHDDLVAIHRRKTGALIAASASAGAIIAGADESTVNSTKEFGYTIGQAFQVIDDILDTTATPEELGKSVGKDKAQGKLTYVSLLGIDGAKAEAKALTEQAEKLAQSLPNNQKLLELAGFISTRTH